MNSRTTWLLLLLATGLFAFIYFFERHLQPAGETALPGRVLPELKAAAVTSLIVRPAQRVEISALRTNTTWQLVKPITYPAATVNVEALLQALEQLTWHSRITAAELKHRPQYSHEFGFDNAPFSLVLQHHGQQQQLLLGSRTPFGDEIYLQVVGRDEIYLVGADLLRLIPRTANDWRDTALTDLSNLTFNRLSVTNGTKAVEFQYTGTNKTWRLVRPLEARADNPKLTQLFQTLPTLRFTEFVTDDPKADLENYGLLTPDLELAFATGDESMLDLQFGKSPTNHPDQVFARRVGTTSIGLIAKEPLAAWRGSFEDFRDRHLVSPADNSVDEVEVHGAGNFILQRQTNDTWQLTAPEELPADPALTRELIGALSGMQIAQFVKSAVTELDLPSYGLADPARQIILRTRPGAGETTNLTLVQLDFGTATNGHVFVRRSDETSVYAVRQADLQNLPTASWQMRDRRIWNFTENDVLQITIQQRGKTRTLLHHGTNAWTFAAGSQGIINNFAIEEAAGSLGELTAAIWTARDDADRAQFGFTVPPQQISVEVKRGVKTETLTLELGGVAPSQLRYAAVTLDGQPWVCELPARVSEMIRAYLTIPADTP